MKARNLMDLTLNNEIFKDKTICTEVDSFIKELQNSLNMENNRTPRLYNDIIKCNSLISNNLNKINDIINKAMEELSYEDDFLYFDYDKNEKTYYLDYYSEGNITRIKMTPEDLKDTHFKEGTFWEKYDEDNLVEANYLKDYIQNNVEIEMESIFDKNIKNKKG